MQLLLEEGADIEQRNVVSDGSRPTVSVNALHKDVLAIYRPVLNV